MNRVLVITSIVTAVAVLIYTAFAGLQWWAIRKQGDYASQQVAKMQAQLDLIFPGRTFKGRFVVVNFESGILGRNVLNHFSLVLNGPGLGWEPTGTSK